ncbi:putative macrophage mannose receptor 1, partial [Apostichopus japonicus]
RVWLGYNDRETEGKFVTVGGCAPKFTFWDKNEPNNQGGEDCAVMWNSNKNSDSGSWNDVPCQNQYSFVCKISL